MFLGEKILLWDDDFKGAFRLSKYRLDIAAAFSSIFGDQLFISIGNTFESNMSPQNFDAVAAARACQARFLTRAARRNLHSPTAFAIEDQIVYPAPPPTTRGLFTTATTDSKISDVPNSLGLAPPPSSYNTFVDDNPVVNLRPCIKAEINANIENLFLLLGFPDEARRPTTIALDKFLDRPLSHLWLQLGFFIDTHAMRVYLPPEKVVDLLLQLVKLMPHRKTFLPLKAADFLGALVHDATVCPWTKHMTLALRRELCNTFYRSCEALERSQLTKPQPVPHTARVKHWYTGVFARKVWRPKRGTFLLSEATTDIH